MAPPLKRIALCLLWPALATGCTSITATGLDAVTTPGTPVRVRAKFEGSSGADLKREPVTFTLLARELTDVTGSEGIAEVTVRHDATGVFPFTARLTERDGPAARGTLYVVDPQRPVAVVDIDGTISDMSGAQVLLGKAGEAETYPGAPELLRDLARTHQVVYLTARDDQFAAPSQAFLEKHRFPAGPVLYNTWGLIDPEQRAQLSPGQHGAFKLKAIQALRARGLKVALGLGNAETDGEAYEGAGLRSYLRTDVEQEGSQSFRFTDTEDLRAKLVADGVLGE